MYAKILMILVLAILCTGCTDPDLPDPYEFENVTPGALALQKSWNPETQTITISTPDDTPRLTIRKVSSVPDLCTFEEVLEIKSFVDYDLNKLKDFRARWKKHKGQRDITKVEWFILKNQSYDITVNDYETIQVEEIHYNNITEVYHNVTVNQTVLVGNHSEIRYHNVWKSFSPVGKSIHAGQTYTVKIVYHKPPELGNVRIQTIPMFAGIECEELTWWNSSWNYRRNVTINHSMVSGAQTNFPVMLAITQTGLNMDANDTRFTDSSDNQIAREIECYNATSGKLVAHFNGTSISNTVDTSFWMYYENAAATEPAADSTYGSRAVWNNNYKLVMHMNQDPNTAGANGIKDSTSNLNHGSPTGFASGKLQDDTYGKKIIFDGAQGISVANHATLNFGSDTDYTLMGHYKSTSNSDFNTIIWKAKATTGYEGYYLRAEITDGFALTGIDGVGGTVELKDSTDWINTRLLHHATADRDSATGLKLYRNGVKFATESNIAGVGNIDNTNSLNIGVDRQANRYYLYGEMYELRISNIIRSTNYITTIHKNLNNPTATGAEPFFTSFGAEETQTIITAYTPSTPLQKTIGDSQLFTVNTSENSQCRWYINGSLKQTNSTGATRHEYTNSSLEEGYWNFTATANTTNITSSQTWWATVNPAGTFGQDMYIDRWMYVTYLNGSNTNLSEFSTDLAPYYLSFYNATDQKTYNYKSGRWEKYAAKVIKPGEAAMLRYTSNVTKTRDNAGGTFGFTMKTGLNHIGHSYNGTRTLSWYNTTIASANLVTITHQNPETGTLSTFTYGSADNGSVDVLQGCGVEVNVSSDTVISGL